MKKIYVSPIATDVEIITEQLLALSFEVKDVEVDTDIDQLSSGRRGEWGNLWK